MIIYFLKKSVDSSERFLERYTSIGSCKSSALETHITSTSSGLNFLKTPFLTRKENAGNEHLANSIKHT